MPDPKDHPRGTLPTRPSLSESSSSHGVVNDALALALSNMTSLAASMYESVERQHEKIDRIREDQTVQLRAIRDDQDKMSAAIIRLESASKVEAAERRADHSILMARLELIDRDVRKVDSEADSSSKHNLEDLKKELKRRDEIERGDRNAWVRYVIGVVVIVAISLVSFFASKVIR